jgi:N-glycosyltransferase
VGEQISRAAHDTEPPPDHGESLTRYLVTEGYPGPEALRTARDILVHARSWQPDVIVRENAEFGGYLAAEALGLPHVSVGAAGGSAGYLDRALLAPALDAGRQALGLPADPQGQRIYAYLHANLMPPEYDTGELAIPNVRCYRQTNPLLPGERLPAWTSELASPPVLAAFGTLHPRTAAWQPVTRAVIAGLGRLGRPAVVAVGPSLPLFDPALPPVRLVDQVAQTLMLEHCPLFVHHGGFNSVREGLRLGVPMVIIPWFTDSLANAARCAEAGVARVLPRDEATPSTVHAACAEVLANPDYQRRAQEMRRSMLTLPPIDELIRDAAALGRRGTGVTGALAGAWSGQLGRPVIAPAPDFAHELDEVGSQPGQPVLGPALVGQRPADIAIPLERAERID